MSWWRSLAWVSYNVRGGSTGKDLVLSGLKLGPPIHFYEVSLTAGTRQVRLRLPVNVLDEARRDGLLQSGASA